MPTIAVASTSATKLAAVASSVERMFKDEVTIVAVAASSGVADQPEGLDETARGAKNRLDHACRVCPTADYVVAMENGIIDVAGNWIDLAVVELVARGGQSFWATSLGVRFPSEAVVEARRRGFATTTVGQVIAEMNPGVDHADPHKFLTGLSRALYLEQALFTVFSQALAQGA